jgi:hypothetical protein
MKSTLPMPRWQRAKTIGWEFVVPITASWRRRVEKARKSKEKKSK